jgi:hypothetical protein
MIRVICTRASCKKLRQHDSLCQVFYLARSLDIGKISVYIVCILLYTTVYKSVNIFLVLDPGVVAKLFFAAFSDSP